MSYITTIGRRKTSVARIYLKAGSGNISVNGRALDTNFPTTSMQMIVNQPMDLTETTGQFDVKINVYGGGFKGQAEAARQGIARAMVKIDEENKPALKAEGFMTRDSRVVERKKPGQPKARKKFQFSKR